MPTVEDRTTSPERARGRRLGPLVLFGCVYAIALVVAWWSTGYVHHPLTQAKIRVGVVGVAFVSLLAVPAVIAWRAKTSLRRNLAVGSGVGILGCGCIAYLLFPAIALVAMHDGAGFTGLLQVRSQIPFDAERWKANQTPWWSQPIRYRMAEDLVERRVLIGMTRSEVESLLGHWDGTTYPFKDRDLVYVLKPTFMDHLWVAIDLDERGHVGLVEIRED